MANIFPRWSNLLPLKIAFCLLLVAGGLVLAFTVYATPKTQVAGYQPAQPIAFSHRTHAGQLAIDCRYCHAFADVAGHANVPSGNTCWNCHQHVLRDSPKLASLRKSVDPTFPGYDGKPVAWVRIHKVPDFVKFDHSAHVVRGVGCKSCHGAVDQMEVVYQDQNLSMSWCLDCHRAPESRLVPLEEVCNMQYDATRFLKDHPLPNINSPADLGRMLKDNYRVTPKTTCATCHH